MTATTKPFVPFADDEAAGDRVHRRLVALQVFTSCLNCAEFDKKTEVCVKFRARPPAEVIVFSCKTNWFPDIPF